MNQSQSWYYSINSQQYGPVPRAELDRVLGSQPPAEVLVWREGMNEWMPASQLGQPVAPVMPYAVPTAPAYQTPQLLAPRRTNGMSIAAMVLGILSVLSFGFFLIPQILAVVFGHIGLNACNSDPELDGKGMAIAGLVMGYIFLGLTLLFFLLVIVA